VGAGPSRAAPELTLGSMASAVISRPPQNKEGAFATAGLDGRGGKVRTGEEVRGEDYTAIC